jgi:hypothetical protein
MANTNIQPTITLHSLIKYTAKYASKPEKKSELYKSIQTEVLRYTNHRSPILSFTFRILNKLITKRD